MKTEDQIKRLFFGSEVHAPWPSKLPSGRLLDPSHRHLTLAFLGNIPYPPLREQLQNFPQPSMKVGTTGYFDSCLPLPPRHPHVISWHARWFHDDTRIHSFQKSLAQWLSSHGYTMETRAWKPHVTLCRQPFPAEDWTKNFVSLPFYTSSIHLYESMGELRYVPIWTYAIPTPFEEIDHTADMAFLVRGETPLHIYQNAFAALAFKAPEMLQFYEPKQHLETVDEIIIALNSIVARADSAIGCPFKAVSFHGDIMTVDSLLQWEMIVDV